MSREPVIMMELLVVIEIRGGGFSTDAVLRVAHHTRVHERTKEFLQITESPSVSGAWTLTQAISTNHCGIYLGAGHDFFDER